MSMTTPWGYTLTGGQTLTDFLTPFEFNAFTANKFQFDTRIGANIPSATAAIRNYCGWHISPNLECEMVYNMRDLRDSFVGPDLLIQLPATFVTSIEKIVLGAVWNEQAATWDGVLVDANDFDLSPSGLLRIFDAPGYDRKAKIYIKYKAGYPDDQIGVIKELTAHRVTHAVTSSYGVMSEAAGGVSVTYNASWAGNTRSTALPDDNREALEPYRVKGVF